MSRFHSLFPGGWLLVSNVLVDDPSSRQLWIKSSYREATSNGHENKTLFITKDAMEITENTLVLHSAEISLQ